jgi:hypothetical protein
MKVFIPVSTIERCAATASRSFVGLDPFSSEGVITLYNKNANVNYVFNNAKKAMDRHGYEAESDSIPEYFSMSIFPILP